MKNTIKYLILLASFGLMASDKIEKKEDKQISQTILDPYLIRDVQKVIAGYLDIYDYNVQKMSSKVKDNIERGSLATFVSKELYLLTGFGPYGSQLSNQIFRRMPLFINGFLTNEKFDPKKLKDKSVVDLNYKELIEVDHCCLPDENIEPVKHVENICNQIFDIKFSLLDQLDQIEKDVPYINSNETVLDAYLDRDCQSIVGEYLDKKIKSIIRICECMTFLCTENGNGIRWSTDIYDTKTCVKHINSLFNSILIKSGNFCDFSKYISAITISEDDRYLVINYQSMSIDNYADKFLKTATVLNSLCTKLDYNNPYAAGSDKLPHANKGNYDRVLDDIREEVRACKNEKLPKTSTIEVWDLQSKKLVYQETYTYSTGTKILAISPNNRYIAYRVSGTDCLCLLDLKTQQKKLLFYSDEETIKINPITEPTLLKFSGNSSYIFAVINDKLLGWHIETGDLLFNKSKPSVPREYEKSIDFSQDGRYMIYLDEDKEKLEEFHRNYEAMTNKYALLPKDILQFSSLMLVQNQGVVLMEELEEENNKK